MATYNFWCGTGGAVANQTATFGTLTIALAGGFKPVNSSGITRDLSSYNSLVSGSLGAYTPSVTGGKLVFSGASGAPNGVVLRCGLASGGTVDITISTRADTYSISTDVEALAARTAIGSTGGKTILFRRGNYSGLTNFGCNNTTYTTELVLEGEGQADTGLGARVSYLQLISVVKYKVKNLECWNNDPDQPAAIELYGTSDNVVIEDCWCHCTYWNPLTTQPADYKPKSAISVSGNSISNLTVQRNLLSDCLYGITVDDCDGTLNIDLNEVRYMTADCIAVGWDSTSTVVNISRNVLCAPMETLAETHCDAIQISTTDVNSSLQYPNFTARQNVAFMSPNISRAYFTGLISFVSNSVSGRQLLNPVIAGNIMVNESAHGITLYNINGGFVGYNTVVRHNTGGSGPDYPSINLGLAVSAGTVLVKHNVAGSYSLLGSATFTQANNVTLGDRGATIPYTDAFNWANPAVDADTYNQVITNLTPKTGGPVDTNDAGPLDVGYCTFGQPRNATGWSYNAGMEV
jgi:hypothetical protein